MVLEAFLLQAGSAVLSQPGCGRLHRPPQDTSDADVGSCGVSGGGYRHPAPIFCSPIVLLALVSTTARARAVAVAGGDIADAMDEACRIRG